MQFYRGTAARLTAVNAILLNGQPGFETDTGQLKIGNGVDRWTDLAYVGNPGGVDSTPTGTGFRHVTADVEDGTVKLVEDADVAAANKDGAAGTPSLRTLGTGAQQACAGNDARLTLADPGWGGFLAESGVTSLQELANFLDANLPPP